MKPPSFLDAVTSSAYDKAATAVAKDYIFLFLIFCAIVAYLDTPELGWWWVAVIFGGIFVSSMLIAAPITGLKLFLAIKVGISPMVLTGRLFYRTMDLAGYIALWFLTRYCINALEGL